MCIRAIKSSQQVSEGRSGRSFEETEGEVLSCLPKATELGNGRLRPRAQNNLCRNMAVGDGGGELLTEKGSKSFRAAIERIRSCVPRPEIFTLTGGHTAPRKQRLLLGRVTPPHLLGVRRGSWPSPPRPARPQGAAGTTTPSTFFQVAAATEQATPSSKCMEVDVWNCFLHSFLLSVCLSFLPLFKKESRVSIVSYCVPAAWPLIFSALSH